MLTATVDGQELVLDRDEVRAVVAGLVPEPVRVHYVVIDGRRFPPKQVLAAVAGLDRADFTTHQARSVLRRLGFGAYRTSDVPPELTVPDAKSRRPGLEEFAGRWIAQQGEVVVVDADTPEAVLAWLHRHDQHARVWRVPASPAEAGSTMSTP